MSVADALRSAGDTLRRQTGTVLPYYALSAATIDVARLPLLVGVLVAYLALASTGRIESLLDELAALNPELLSPDSPAGLPPEVGERLAAVLFAPSVVVPLALAVVAAVVVTVLVRGITRAAALSAIDAGLSDRDPLAAGVAGMRHWKTFAGLVVLRWGLLLVAGVPFLAAVVGGVATVDTADPTALGQQAVVAALAALLGGLVTLVAVVAVLALLTFAGPAAVVDDLDLGDAVRRSVGVPFAHPVGFLLYGVVVVGSYVVLGVAGVLVSLAGVDRLLTVASAFFVAPLLDGVAVALYADWTAERERESRLSGDERVAPGSDAGTGVEGDSRSRVENTDDSRSRVENTDNSRSRVENTDNSRSRVENTDNSRSGVENADDLGFVFGDEVNDGAERREEDRKSTLLGDVRDAVSAGVRELGAFLRTEWGYVAVSAVTLLGGLAAGWAATVGSGIRIGTPTDPASVFGLVPVGPFVNIAVNNWFVATTAGFSGMFAGAPTLGTLLFNGLLVGAVAGVVDPIAFVAFVAPHGVIELPAIAIAGGVGLRLGHVAWGVWRDERPSSTLVDELGRTWRLVVGLLVVFVVAGFVEAFVTPHVAAAVLG